MSANAKATTTVYINNEPAKQALTELETKLKATKEAREKAFESGDQSAIKKLDRQIESLNGQIDRTRKKFLDVDAVVKDLGGASIRDLNTALAKSRAEFTKMRQTDPGYEEKRKQIQQLEGALDAAKGKTAQATGMFGNMGGMLTKVVGWAMAAYAAIQTFSSGISKVFTVRSEFEKYEAVLKNNLGTQQAARDKMAELTQAATELPVALTEVTEAYIKFKNRGIDPTMAQMTQMTDMAMSQGKSLDMYVEAILDAQMGSFERLKEFSVDAETAGNKVSFTFKNQTVTVDKNSEAIYNYLLSLGKIPGIAGQSAAVIETMGGMASNAGDATDKLANALGEGGLGDAIKGSLKLYTEMTSELADYIKMSPAEKIREEQSELNVLVGAIMSCNDNQVIRNQLISELQQNYPDFLGNVKAEEVTNKMLADNLKEVNAEYVKKIQIAVIEEDIADVSKRQTEAMREQRKLLKLINKTYIEHVGVLDEKLTLEEKLAAIAKVNTVERLPNGRTMEFSYGGVVLGWRDMLKKGQENIDALTKEYESLFVEKSKVGPVATPPPAPEPEKKGSGNNASGKTDKQKERDLQKQKLDALEASFNEEQSLISKNHAADQTNDATYKALMLESELNYLQKKRDLLVSFGESTVDVDKAIAQKTADAELEVHKNVEEAKKALREAGINNMVDAAEQAANIENARWEEEKRLLQEQINFKKELSSEELELNELTKQLIYEKEKEHNRKLDEINIARQLEQDEIRILESNADIESIEAQRQLAELAYREQMSVANHNRLQELKAKQTFDKQIRQLDLQAYTQKKQLELAKAEILQQGFGVLVEIFGKQSALGKAFYLMEQAAAIGQVIFKTAIANASAVAASPLTFGQPWVAVNTAMGAVSVASILAQTYKGMTGKKSGGYTDPAGSDDKVVDYVHANEFVANANAVRNPTIKPVLDIINMAQRNGTIQSINLPAALSQSGGRGYLAGGYTSEADAISNMAQSQAAQQSYDDNKELLAATLATLKSIQDNGVMGVWDHDYFTRSQAKMDALKKDVTA